ncbi:hypothetical protein POL68_40530 [Stigmatella sp. ncwal1]|uniref:Uncharacterized protein n=1 Tax=Stigmatella ashevillensis TaxID=2995309 RepID=A0ABT5DMB1_9BACT|nr:hypothetical protein [Stigmatella ashevillena]MDC0714806.1 hypothetical protein [Stigmatella ashevillena]
MTELSPKMCATCGRSISSRELYYRFTLVLQGEQDVLDEPTPGDAGTLDSLLQQLEQGPEDPSEWEEQVHWERSGVICPACRDLVRRTLTLPVEDTGPH